MLAHVDNRITYRGNGNATEFAYQFKILDRTDIKVLLTDADGKEKLLTKDYYVDVEKNVVRYPGYAVGAEVPESERPPVLPTGWKLTIYREVPVTQETDLPDQYPFNQVEDIGDKLTMIAQQLTDVTSRSLKISVSKSADIDATIPWENGKSFRISDDGANLELTEDPAKVLPLAQSKLEATTAQANIAAAKAAAAAESESKAESYAANADASKTAAAASSSDAANSAAVAAGYKADTLLMKNAVAENVKAAKESEANAKQASVSASASETEAKAAKVAANEAAANASNSASEAKRYESEANSYAENAKEYAATATTKASETTAKVIEATDEANRAKAEADRAKSISDNIGNPVSDVTENNGSVTVTKSDGTQSTFMAFPQGENGALPIANGGTGATTASDACANIGAFPTSGGIFKGTTIIREDDNADLSIFGGTDWRKGAALLLSGNDNSKFWAGGGAFQLSTGGDPYLLGYPNGELLWNSMNVACIASQGANYIRFSSGLQITFQWLDGGADFTVTLPMPFKNTDYRLSMCDSGVGRAGVGGSIISTTQVRVYTTVSRFGGYMICIGWWK